MALDQYPGRDALAQNQRLVCQWAGCKARRPFKTLTMLKKHVMNVHGVSRDAIKAHWLHREALKSEIPPYPLSALEKANVRLAFDEDGEPMEDHFTCVTCDKTLGKFVYTILFHYLTVHKESTLSPSVIKEWLVYKDATTIKNTTNMDYLLKHLRLTKV